MEAEHRGEYSLATRLPPRGNPQTQLYALIYLLKRFDNSAVSILMALA
jgi:hypothetical protein